MDDRTFDTWLARVAAILILTTIAALCVAFVVWAWGRIL